MGTVIDSRGVVTTKGGGLTVVGEAEFQGGQKSSVTAVTSATTASAGGVFTVSGSAAVAVTLPDPSAVAGAHLIFRSLSAHAHTLSSSQVPQDTLTITDGTNNGTRLALENIVGSSVVLVSDGLSFLVAAASGSHTIATPSA